MLTTRKASSHIDSFRMAEGDKSKIVEHTIKVVKDPNKLRDDEKIERAQCLSLVNQYSK